MPNRDVAIVRTTPGVDELPHVVRAVRDWQHDGAPVQLHPGDLGWHWRFGAAAVAAAVRTWSRDGELLAVGMLDTPRLIRMAISPAADLDEELARQLVSDMTHPAADVLPDGEVCVEARFGAAFRTLLVDDGWGADEPWTPLERSLTEPVPPCGLRIEVIGPDTAAVRVAVHRASFAGSTFTEEAWRTMVTGPGYEDARCLVAYDDQDDAVAAVTVWSAGPGRPGLLEPLGAHHDHRGHGHGTAIAVTAAAALRELGSSTATVCTPTSNVGGVATYRAAGFRALPDVRDLRRGAGEPALAT